MSLPGVERAVVDAAKIRDYLLSDSHPVGRVKAAFLVAVDYASADWQLLAADLRSHAVANYAIASELSEYGQ